MFCLLKELHRYENRKKDFVIFSSKLLVNILIMHTLGTKQGKKDWKVCRTIELSDKPGQLVDGISPLPVGRNEQNRIYS